MGLQRNPLQILWQRLEEGAVFIFLSLTHTRTNAHTHTQTFLC
jgi:hypothetical protein